MNFVTFFKQFVAKRAGKTSLLFSLLAFFLLPIFIFEWQSFLSNLRLVELYNIELGKPLQLVQSWFKDSETFFKLDLPTIVLMIVRPMEVDPLYLFFSFLMMSLIFGVVAFAVKNARVSASLGICLSFIVSAAYISMKEQKSYYTGIQKAQNRLANKIFNIEHQEKQGNLDFYYNDRANVVGDIYAPDNLMSNHSKAKKFYLKAANNNDRAAQFKLGVMYLSGLFTNKVKAKKWINKSIVNTGLLDVDDIERIKKLEEKYKVGTIIPEANKMVFEAMIVLEAESSRMANQCDIANFYKEGKGVARNYEAAYQWSSIAAANPINTKRYRTKETKQRMDKCQAIHKQILAHLSDDKIAELDAGKDEFLREWKEKKAEIKKVRLKKGSKRYFDALVKRANNEKNFDKLSLAGSQRTLSHYYRDGRGEAPKNPVKAAMWLRKAIDNEGRPSDMYELALLYQEGVGVEKSSQDAYYWAALAASSIDVADYATKAGSHTHIHLRRYNKYIALQEEVAKNFSLEARAQVNKRIAIYLDKKHPSFFKGGIKVKGAKFLSDQLKQEKKP